MLDFPSALLTKKQFLLSELQTRGLRLLDEAVGAASRRGGGGPTDSSWFGKLYAAGVDSLGMHLEAWDEDVRRKIMPGKAEVSLAFYLEAFGAAVAVFGRGQVITYLLAGLGDSIESLHEAARTLIDLGVYPFVVPFVPVGGTPLANLEPPSADFMRAVLQPIGEWLTEAGMTSDTVKAGCAKCAACSTLSTFEGRK